MYEMVKARNGFWQGSKRGGGYEIVRVRIDYNKYNVSFIKTCICFSSSENHTTFVRVYTYLPVLIWIVQSNKKKPQLKMHCRTSNNNKQYARYYVIKQMKSNPLIVYCPLKIMLWKEKEAPKILVLFRSFCIKKK